MPFPSVLNTFNRPAATDRLNSPAHATLHNTVSSAVGQIEQLIGLSTTSVVGSFFYDIRSPDSNGGGHVQTANKGGTGQTTFLKGDLLVATSASVVAKLAVGADNQIIKADSSVAAGIKWIDDSTPKISTSIIGSVIGNGIATETSVFSVSIPGSVLGTNNVVRATLNAQLDYDGAAPFASVLAYATYGGGRVASVLLAAFDALGMPGTIEYRLFGNGAVNAQYGELKAVFNKNVTLTNPSVVGTFDIGNGTASVASGGAQNIGLTWKFSNANTGNKLTPRTLIVEKII